MVTVATILIKDSAIVDYHKAAAFPIVAEHEYIKICYRW